MNVPWPCFLFFNHSPVYLAPFLNLQINNMSNIPLQGLMVSLYIRLQVMRTMNCLSQKKHCCSKLTQKHEKDGIMSNPDMHSVTHLYVPIPLRVPQSYMPSYVSPFGSRAFP